MENVTFMNSINEKIDIIERAIKLGLSADEFIKWNKILTDNNDTPETKSEHDNNVTYDNHKRSCIRKDNPDRGYTTLANTLDSDSNLRKALNNADGDYHFAEYDSNKKSKYVSVSDGRFGRYGTRVRIMNSKSGKGYSINYILTSSSDKHKYDFNKLVPACMNSQVFKKYGSDFRFTSTGFTFVTNTLKKESMSNILIDISSIVSYVSNYISSVRNGNN